MSDLSDLIDFDSLLSADKRALRDSVRSFVDSEIKPNIAGWYEEAVFPLEIVPELAKRGLLGMHLKGYGCAGRSAVEYGLAVAELEAGDSGLRTFVSVQGSLATSAIYKHGSDSGQPPHRRRRLPLNAGPDGGTPVPPSRLRGAPIGPPAPLDLKRPKECRDGGFARGAEAV